MTIFWNRSSRIFRVHFSGKVERLDFQCSRRSCPNGHISRELRRYRVLRHLVPRDVFTPTPDDQRVKTGIVLDVETTGLDSRTDEVIELGMVKFSYLLEDRIGHVLGIFSALNEPT